MAWNSDKQKILDDFAKACASKVDVNAEEIDELGNVKTNSLAAAMCEALRAS